MWLTVGVAVASGLGSVARYSLDQAVRRRTTSPLPYATLLVNVTGSFVLGLVLGFSLHHGLSSDLTLLLGTGFAGGYTTLSTWAWETLSLARNNQRLAALCNLAVSIVLGLLAAGAGLSLALL